MKIYKRQRIRQLILLTIICISFTSYNAQITTVPNFTIENIINDNTTRKKLTDFEGKYIILDFFGTWCIPCIKALPHLTEIQNNYKKTISVVLVSTEEINDLTRFVQNNKPFSLPIITDKSETIYNFFTPPSYPYTIILNNKLQYISAITTEALTNKYLDSLLTIQESIPSTAKDTISTPSTPTHDISMQNNYVTNAVEQLASQLLLAVKTGEDAQSFIDALRNLNEQQLKDSLANNEQKTAFWLNIYNAYTNYALKNKPELYKNRKKFFKSKFITIAHKKLSLDNIEHGILRRSKVKLSLGYLNKWFVNKFEKTHRVTKLDWRIHFALNCGAKSCPPIAFYKAPQLNNQLNIAAKNFLISECIINNNNNTVAVPTFMSWFRKDFGGKKNIVRILKKFEIIPAGQQPKITFKKYDWNLYVENYSTTKN
jgi:thiol-disulfide isomerase/thioredoxin